MLPPDVPALAALFRASIAILTEDDYDEDQREAWAARADDEAAFGRVLESKLTLVATRGPDIVGFIALEGKDAIAMLYVDPASARQGVGTLLLDAVVRLAAARGAGRITVDASDTARALFLAAGFVPTMRNTVTLGDQWLGNTTMERKLEGATQGTTH